MMKTIHSGHNKPNMRKSAAPKGGLEFHSVSEDEDEVDDSVVKIPQVDKANNPRD